jgi:hypothetical protein
MESDVSVRGSGVLGKLDRGMSNTALGCHYDEKNLAI